MFRRGDLYCLSVLFEYTNGWPMLCDSCKAFYAQVNSSTRLRFQCDLYSDLFRFWNGKRHLGIKRQLERHLCISKIWAFHTWVIDGYKNLIETKVFDGVRGKCTVFSFCMVDPRLHWMTETWLPFLRRWGSYCAKLRKKKTKKKTQQTLDVIDVIFVHLIYFPSLPPNSSYFCSYLSSRVHFPPVLILTVMI